MSLRFLKICGRIIELYACLYNILAIFTGVSYILAVTEAASGNVRHPACCYVLHIEGFHTPSCRFSNHKQAYFNTV